MSNKSPILLNLEFEIMVDGHDHASRAPVANDASHRLSQDVHTVKPTVNKTVTDGTNNNPTEGGPGKTVGTNGNPTEGGPGKTPTGGGTNGNPVEGGPGKTPTGGGTNGNPVEGGPGPTGGGTNGNPVEGGPPNNGNPVEGGPGGSKVGTIEIPQKLNIPPEAIVPVLSKPTLPVPITPVFVTPPGEVTIPNLPKTEIVIPDPIVPIDQTVVRIIKETPPTHNVPPDILTGDSPKGRHGGPRYDQASAGQESLTAPAIGLNHARIDHIATSETKPLKPEHPYALAEADGVPNHDKTVIAAHVTYNGSAPFLHLDKLVSDYEKKGVRDEVTIDTPEGKTTYKYDHKEIVKNPKTHKDWLYRAFASGNPDSKELVLVTCTGEFDSKIRHYKDKLVVYLRDVNATGPNANVNEAVASTFTHPGTYSEQVKVNTNPNPALKPSVSTGDLQSVNPTEKPVPVVTSTVQVDGSPAGAVVNNLKPVTTSDGTASSPSVHAYSVLSDGQHTFLNSYGKNINLGLSLNGLNPASVEASHTDILKNKNGSFIDNTAGVGLGFSSINSTLSVPSIKSGVYGFDAIYAQQKLGNPNSLNGTSLFETGTLGASRYGLTESLAGGGKLTFKDRYTLYGGAELDLSSGRSRVTPLLGASIGLNKRNTTSFEVNYDGNRVTAGFVFRR